MGSFQDHPAFADLPQGVRVDENMTLQTDQNVSELNQDLQNQLRHEHQLQLGYQPAPKFNPKPSLGR